jgi:hypothetical protein
MTGMPMNWAHELGRPKDKPAVTEISLRLRLVGAMLRTIFILAILLVIVKVSLPQSETIWTAYDTPADLVRMALGLIVGVWIAVQLFIMRNAVANAAMARIRFRVRRSCKPVLSDDLTCLR